MDRRDRHFIASKPHLLDVTNDIDALAAETYGQLERAHTAHWTNEPTAFLRAITTAGEKVIRIGKIARTAAGEIESAPDVSPDQLLIWTRADRAVVAPDGAAA